MKARFHHFGVPTTVKGSKETFLEDAGVYITDPESHPYSVEFLRFTPNSPMPDAIKKTPHAAFVVPSVEQAIKGKQVILPPMVKIAGGEAKTGSGFWDVVLRRGFGDEFPRHKVVLTDYAIGRFPVTNAEYDCFMKAGGYKDERYWTEGGRNWRRGEKVPTLTASLRPSGASRWA